jgi:hypothetical protein
MRRPASASTTAGAASIGGSALVASATRGADELRH